LNILGKTVHRPKPRAGANEDQKDTRRPDMRKEKAMAETQRLLWDMSMPACANMNDAMQKFTGVSYETTDPHKVI